MNCTVWKVSKYGVFSGPYFPIFGLNTETYGVNLHIPSKYGKIRTRKNSVLDTSHAVLMNKKYKKIYRAFNYIENFLILASTVTGCVYMSAFASLVGIPAGIASSARGIKICAITAVIKKRKSIFKKKKHDKIVLLAKKVN